ncbi:lysophospholipid acyltransferase family protein [Halorhodospira halochloris]|uniref:lysophospholipid acyltransferase family protein n=1 Tax=Halorhodospira halochloris TaxID=1052 RepID=UPI00076F8479|nr:lysophospholipid acyltransferase family protein [Halorhodospira halochloris]MBK1650827.1 1-acyl-sn-glycerol-3-phosphate acyltransferase [Halorhodospira halochloris]
MKSNKPRILLGSTAHLSLMILSTPLWAIGALFVIPLPYQWRYNFLMTWSWLIIDSLRPLCGIRVSVRGKENIPQQPCVVMSKHQSAWETLALAKYFHPTTWVLKRSLLRIPFFGWGLSLLRPIAIDRGATSNARQQVLEQGIERLNSGLWVLIFPEGTRVSPGEKARYQGGGVQLAIKSERPIVPVAHNAGKHWPRRSFLRYPGTIDVVIGPPIETRGRTKGEVLAQVESWIEGEMVKLD